MWKTSLKNIRTGSAGFITKLKSKLMLSFLLSTGRCFVYAGWKENLVNKGASLLPVLNYLLKLIVVSNKSLWSDVAEEFLEWL